MVTFKEYLLEARMAPLYHGTSYEGLENIIVRKQGIKAVTLQMPYKYTSKDNALYSGVSLSRDKNFSAGFGGEGVTLELDQQKLNQNYKIIPFDYFAKIRGTKNYGIPEHEEFVIAAKYIPISQRDSPQELKFIPTKYITRIWIKKFSYVGKMKKLIDQIRDEYGADFIRLF